MLERNQLKSVFGGYSSNSGGYGFPDGCEDTCVGDADCPDGMMGTTYSCKTKKCNNGDTKMCVQD